LQKFDNLLILSDANEYSGIDAKTGVSLWKLNNSVSLYVVNSENNIGIAYKFPKKKGLRKIISIDNELKATNTIGFKDTFNCFLHYNNHKFFTNGEKTFVVNANGKIIAELNVTSSAFLIEHILYDKQDNSFIAIDLRNLISLP